jgi:hypothetical protein
MTGLQRNDQTTLRLGEEWIQALIEKDFHRMSEVCQPDVTGLLITPSHVHTLEHAPDLTRSVEQWFGACDSIQKEQSRVAMVGKKLAVFYRLALQENGETYTMEQQMYCTLRDGRIAQLNLLCSGFQLVPAELTTPVTQPAAAPTTPSADAL